MQKPHKSQTPPHLVGDGHLSDLFLRWQANPERWNTEMVETIDKLISMVLGRTRCVDSCYKFWESYADLKQDLRLYCFEKVLPRVKYAPPSDGKSLVELNKRLYNYLKWSIIRRIQNAKTSGIRNNTREIDSRPAYVQRYGGAYTMDLEWDHECVFEENTRNVAILLSQGKNKALICRKLKMSDEQYETHLGVLRAHYTELGIH